MEPINELAPAYRRNLDIQARLSYLAAYNNTSPTFHHFLALPIEIRSKIYKYAILQDFGSQKFDKTKNPTDISGYGFGSLCESAITKVSYETRLEALPVFYALRRFPLLNLPAHVYNDDEKLATMRSLYVDLEPLDMEARIPSSTGRIMMAVDLYPKDKFEVWLGIPWGGERFLPAEKYWDNVIMEGHENVRDVVGKVKNVMERIKGQRLTRTNLTSLIASCQ